MHEKIDQASGFCQNCGAFVEDYLIIEVSLRICGLHYLVI